MRHSWMAPALLTLVLAACSATPTPPVQPATAVPAAQNAALPVDNTRGSADQIVVAIGGESEEGYDPTLGWGRYGSPLFHSTLLRRDADLNVVNDLATGYTVSADRRTWTITIRPDVVFSDGTPLTAEDVAYTFTAAQNSGGKTDVTTLERAIARNPTTVELILKQPQSTFVNRLITLGIVPKHAHGPDYAQRPIGSGPYQLVNWERGKQLIVEVNPRYYGQQPAITRIVFLFVSNEGEGAFLAAKAGQVQLASVPATFASQQVDAMRLVAVQSVDNRGLMFPFVPNTGQKTTDGAPIGNDVTANRAIRQAVNVAIDRTALVEGVLEGRGSPAFGPVSGLAWEQPSAVINDADATQAQQILAAGGWKDSDNDGILERDGRNAAFTILYPASDTTRQALALAVADMLRPIGIAANVEGKSWDDIQQRMHQDVVVFGWGSHDQTEMYNLYHSASAGKGWYNTGFYANAAIDGVLDLALGAPSEQEANAFWKQAQWDGKQGFTAKGDAAWAWLVNLSHTYFVHSCLDIGKPQIEPHGHGWPITANIERWTWTCK